MNDLLKESLEEPQEDKPPSLDWHWQFKNRISTLQDLKSHFPSFSLSESSQQAEAKFPMAITPYYASLIRDLDPSDPIFSMSVPQAQELIKHSCLSEDPLNEEHHMPFPFLVHRYPDRVLLLVTNTCAMYCRHSLGENTKIIMSDFSTKPISEVKIFDKIITHTGNVGIVYDVFNSNYEKDIISITTSRNQKIETTQEHPFLVLKRNSILCNSGEKKVCKPNSKNCLRRHPKRVTNFVPGFIEAKEIVVGDYLCVPIPKQKDIIFDNIDFAYFLGLYTSEGDVPRRKNGMPICTRFSFGISEEFTLVEKIKNIVERNNYGKISISPDLKKSICTVRVYNKDLSNMVEECCGKYSDKKILSEDIVLKSTDEFRKNLLLGMLDGDGFFTGKYKKNIRMSSIEFNTVSYQLANQIFMLLASLGFPASIFKNKNERKNVFINNRNLTNFKTNYSVRITDHENYCKFLNIEKTKAYSAPRSFAYNGYIFCKVCKINKRTPKKNEKFYDLSILGEESYLAESVSVHNCTRKRISGNPQCKVITNEQLGQSIDYLKEHTEVHDVIISGGDQLTLTDSVLENIVSKIRSVSSVDIIRIGSRVPVVMPMRITDELTTMLKKYHPIFINTHFNHPVEITDEAKIACGKLVDAGIPVGNQTVLLKGINDDPKIIEDLCRGLIKMRVRPYYLFQCDLVNGVEHFRTDISCGIEIMKHLRGRLSGMAIPNFIVDLPNGGGKIELLPNYIVSKDSDGIVFENGDGQKFYYKEKK